MDRAKFASIIITHFTDNKERSETMERSFQSLLENTKYPYELIVVDNGGSRADSQLFLEAAEFKQIHTYIKNKDNMHFGYARNQGLALAQGDYIVIADNDIYYEEGWLTKCIEVLEMFPDKKIYTTPMPYPMKESNSRYHQGFLYNKDKTEEYDLNMRAGSNCFVIRREDMEKIGRFAAHRIAGTKWTDKAVRMGYLACVIGDSGQYALDMGIRRGYNTAKPVPICLGVTNSTKLYFNQDEYKKDDSRLHRTQQRTFNS